MKIVRCKNGDWYDADEFSSCPHCGAGPANEGRESTTEKRKKPWSFIGGHKEKTTSDGAHSEQRGTSTSKSKHNAAGDDRENGVTEAKWAAVVPAEDMGDKRATNLTLDFWQNENDSESERPMSIPQEKPYDHGIGSDESVDRHAPKIQEDGASLRDVVRKAAANSEGKTMSYFNTVASAKADNDPATVRQAPSFEPTVGWLVCVGGKSFGRCFEIYAEKNSVGRSEENRIVISDDEGISRIKHAFIIYEPKKRDFYLQPGGGSGLTYLNDEYITDSKKLKSHDIIELGGSKLMFVPLCGESFSWEDHILKGE